MLLIFFRDVVKHKEFLSIDFIKLLEMLTHQDLCASEENVSKLLQV